MKFPFERTRQYDPALLKTVLDGKAFNPKKEHADHTEYGKAVFAEAVVSAKSGRIDFSGFEDLLTRIEDVLMGQNWGK